MSVCVSQSVPSWLPDPIRHYLHHTEGGVPLRELARGAGLNVSTLSRQVRHYENRRDDPLMDNALRALSGVWVAQIHDQVVSKCHFDTKDMKDMKDMCIAPPEVSVRARKAVAMQVGRGSKSQPTFPEQEELEHEARRILRRMVEPGAKLVFAADMDKAVILRDYPDGRSVRTAVLDRRLAQACILKDWIICIKAGRISSYEISAAGRLTLKNLLAPVSTDLPEITLRPGMAETPIAVLARRKDRDGRPFLDANLVAASERLREDYILSQLHEKTHYSWDKIQDLVASIAQDDPKSTGFSEGQLQARHRVALALQDLGPGLSEVALRVCCHLEGVESAEQRMGWAARSGKIVLRIALQRLRYYYEKAYGRAGPLIG